jgi:hypothetical protein
VVELTRMQEAFDEASDASHQKTSHEKVWEQK